MEKSIYDEPLFRLGAVIAVIIAVIAIVAANSVYFPPEAPLAKVPKVTTQEIEIQVVYAGDWSGTYGDVGRTFSIVDTGTKTIPFSDADVSVSASIQKQDDTARTLTVRILKNGAVVAEDSTAEAYGSVTVVYSLV